MKKVLFIFTLSVMAPMSYGQQPAETVSKIIALERAALERWNNGDVNGFLEISAPDVTYFDPYLDYRVEGLAKLAELYKPLQGKIKVDKCEMQNPRVQLAGNISVLTFNLLSQSGSELSRWNCTEVYRLEKDGNWKIIHTHWSFTKPELK